MRPPRSGNRPTRALVERVISEVSREHRIARGDLLVARRVRVVRARWLAWSRIIEQSGCSINGLADVWGVDRQAIWRAENIRKASAA